MNVNAAINAHVAWKQRLAKCLAGDGEKLDPSVVGRDDQCDLGKWIHGEGQQLASDTDLRALRAQHAVFHTRAAEVVELCQRGDKSAAQQLMDGGYSTAANAVIRTLGALKARSVS